MTTARDVTIIDYIEQPLLHRKVNRSTETARAILESLLSAPESVRLELAAKLNPWRPIETAPKWGTKILVHTTRKGIPRCEVAYWHQPANPEAPGFWNAGIKATHWLPLPVPPSEDKS